MRECQCNMRQIMRNTWNKMKSRCYDPSNQNFRYYGARGIQVCQRWLESFEAFVEDMGPRPTASHRLDRINNDGNYEPGNVKWSSPKESILNRRYTVWITIEGQTKSASDWAREYGIDTCYVAQRIRRGMDPVLAVKTPVRHKSAPGTRKRPRIRAVPRSVPRGEGKR
jgi:hypothetical protein